MTDKEGERGQGVGVGAKRPWNRLSESPFTTPCPLPPVPSVQGFALAYVLIVALVIAIIASGLLAMVLLRYNATERLANGVKGKEADQAALATLIAAWSPSGASGVVNYCATGGGISCSNPSPAGSCNCNCTWGHETIAVSGPVGGPCQVQISCDPNAAGGCP